MVSKEHLSNALLFVGAVALVSFGILELMRLQPDPLLPAFSALFIGCTAVLDRMGMRRLQ